MNRPLLLLAILALLSACSPRIQGGASTPAKAKKPKNVIFMIGDGMGVSQVTAAIYSSKQPLNLERFPVSGLVKTHAADRLITDSAAGATAYATGKKTFVGGIGVDADSVPQTNIFEIAKANQYATGMVLTAIVNDATPAAFYAHQVSRRKLEAIAWDLVRANLELVIGGGSRYFSDRRDGDNLLFALKVQGYTIRNAQTPLSELSLPEYKKLAYFTDEEQPTTAAKGREYLQEAAAFAPPFLKERSNKGFFLLVEGSQIDKGGHANSAPYVMSELLDFDKAVGEMLDFAEQDGQTLVIVLADHETGGLTLKQANDWTRNDFEPVFSTGGHTCSMVPVYAYGPGAQKFSGIQDNTEIFHKLIELLGWQEN